MPSFTLEAINQLLSKLKANSEVNVSAFGEQMSELFPVLTKEDQKNFSSTFYKWAGRHKIKCPLIFCYSRLLRLADNFYCEQHETVLSEGPALQKAFIENNEPAAAAAIGALPATSTVHSAILTFL